MSTQPDFDFSGFNEALVKASREMGRIVRNLQTQMAARRADRTPEQIDLYSQVHYDMAVKRERTKGLAFVRAEARRVEKELGL